MTSFYGRALFVSALLLLTACNSVYRGNISTFHEMTVPGGEKVMITPMRTEKTDSLEFRRYADILAGHMQSIGYSQPGEGEPELIAGFDVTINDGREKLINRLDINPYWQRSYWAYGRFWNPFFSPYNNRWRDNEIVARTVYVATLTFELRKPDGEMVYEGRVELETRSKDLPTMLPYLADALFKNFPGENGVTQRISIEREPKAE